MIWPIHDGEQTPAQVHDRFCDTVALQGSYEEPAEMCEETPLEGTDKCDKHTDDRSW